MGLFKWVSNKKKGEILKHTIQLCGMTKALGDKYPGALVNAVQPLVVCEFYVSSTRFVANTR